MPLSSQEQIKPQLHSQPQVADGRVLGFRKKTKRKNHQPRLDYQVTENPDLSLVEKAFDILFEETVQQYGYLTSQDN